MSIFPRDDGLDGDPFVYPDGRAGVDGGALIGQRISHLVREGGGIVSPRVSYRIDDSRLRVDYVQVTSAVEDQAKIARIGRLLDEGELTPRIAPGGVFSFAEAADAYRMVLAGGFRGRVVLTFDT